MPAFLGLYAVAARTVELTGISLSTVKRYRKHLQTVLSHQYN